MIIDIHTHIWESEESHIPQFIKGMDEYGIDKAVVHPLPPRISTEFVGRVCQEYSDRLIPFASLVPSFGSYGRVPGTIPEGTQSADRLELLVKDYDFKGVKLHPSIQGFMPNDPIVVGVVRKAVELGLPILIHTGPGLSGRMRYNDVLYVDDLALDVPDAIIIMAHGDILQSGHYIAKKHANVYMDIAVHWPRICKLIKGIGEDAIGFAGAEKILLGTDASPRHVDAFKEHIGLVESLDISEKDRRLILGENARQLLDI